MLIRLNVFDLGTKEIRLINNISSNQTIKIVPFLYKIFIKLTVTLLHKFLKSLYAHLAWKLTLSELLCAIGLIKGS